MDFDCSVHAHRAVLAVLVLAIGLLGSLLLAEPGPEIRVSDRTKSLKMTGRHLSAAGDATELLRKAELDRRVTRLIAELSREENKVRGWTRAIPGGELLVFTPPMIELIRLGEPARVALENRLQDQTICNEVAVILGAIGTRETIPILIAAYPKQVYRELPSGYGDDEYYALRNKHICFTYALTYLTAQPIGRDRTGTIFEEATQTAWQAWWKSRHESFVIPATKPRSTWVPSYDYSMRDPN
ncbi:MAG: repeat protein [Planctomycetaceae bacterium]|nr:repeat protein [Planctomycetaceae bacterium]